MAQVSTSEKRSDGQAPDSVQRGNARWWNDNPMSYDWHGELATALFSKEWFDAIDARFLYGSRLFATDKTPFDRILPLSELQGKHVLEIGCGMGLHTETLARA